MRRRINILLYFFITILSSSGSKQPPARRKLRSLSAEEEAPLPHVTLINSGVMKRAYKEASNTNNDIDWSNVVIIIPTYNSESANELLKSSYNTWMRYLGNADVVLVTDDDDPRSDDEILPRDSLQANMHVYRSSAIKEGRRTRYKVIDALDHVLDVFNDKDIFMKIDTDSYILPHNLITVVNGIHKNTYPLPVELGRGVCITSETCYSHGGMYAYNKPGLQLMLSYVSQHTPSIYSLDIKNELNNDNLMAHEDYFTSYAFQQATDNKYPIINMHGVSESLMRLKQSYKNKMKRPFYSIHNVKQVGDFYRLHNLFYDGDENAKEVVYDVDGFIQWAR